MFDCVLHHDCYKMHADKLRISYDKSLFDINPNIPLHNIYFLFFMVVLFYISFAFIQNKWIVLYVFGFILGLVIHLMIDFYYYMLFIPT